MAAPSRFCRYRTEKRTEAERDNLLVVPQPPHQIFGPSATSVCVYVGLLKKHAKNIGTSKKKLQLKSFLKLPHKCFGL